MKKLLLLPFLLLSIFILGQVEIRQQGLITIQGNDANLALLKKAHYFFYLQPNIDSAIKYATLAKTKSTESKDHKAQTTALLMLADIEGRLKGNLDIMQSLANEALQLSIYINDQVGKASALRILSIIQIWDGDKKKAERLLAEAFQLAKTSQDLHGLGWTYYLYGFYYSKKGIYLKAFENLLESRALGQQLNENELEAISLLFIARSFNHSGDPAKAIEIYHQAFGLNTSAFLLFWPHMEDLGMAHLKLKQFDSAIYYQQKHRANILALTFDEELRKRFSKWNLPDFTLETKLESREFKEVLNKIEPELNAIRNNRDKLLLMHSLLLAVKSYHGLGHYKKAHSLNQELIRVARMSSNFNFLQESYKQQASIYKGQKQFDSSWYYMNLHDAMKDKIAAEQYKLRTFMLESATKAEKHIALLNKDKVIQRQQLALKDKELKDQLQLKQLLISIIIGLILISVTVVINILLKRKNDNLKNEQKQAALQKKSLELEMLAFRAQMNPHFIFNCLSAIDSLIHTGNADKATIYLSRFARLIRLVLDSLKNNLVSFQRDFETMQLYLELEQFRCNNKFSYSLVAESDLVNSDYKVPPLIAQPFIENAIHHGLLNKQEDNRNLQINASIVDGQIVYSIVDNGIGRRKAAVLKELNKPGQQSYGIDISRERVNLHNRNSQNTDVTIIDLEEEDGKALGTKAIVKINSEVFDESNLNR